MNIQQKALELALTAAEKDKKEIVEIALVLKDNNEYLEGFVLGYNDKAVPELAITTEILKQVLNILTLKRKLKC